MKFETIQANLPLSDTQMNELHARFIESQPDGTAIHFLRYLQKNEHIAVEDVLRVLTLARVDVNTCLQDNTAEQLDDVVENLELEGELGAGAMGEVHIARDLILKRQIAVKWIKEHAVDEHTKARFIREILINAQLDHPNIIPVYSMEETRLGDLAYTMKLVRGQTMADMISDCAESYTSTTSESISLEARLELFLKVCDAMHYAHTRGVIHRDLKPANIMIGQFGEVYVMDWGIARLIGVDDPEDKASSDDVKLNEDGDSTQDGAVIGTLAHISPEQARGEITKLDGGSDQYVLGLILFELVTLRRAIPKGNIRDMLRRAQRGIMAPVVHLSPQVKIRPELVAIINKATKNRAAERYESVSEFASDIRQFMREEPVIAKPDTMLQKLLRWITKHRIRALFAFLTVALLGLISNLYNLHQQQKQREAAQEAQLIIQQELAREEDIRRQFVNKVSRSAYNIEGQFIHYRGLLRGLSATATLQLEQADKVTSQQQKVEIEPNIYFSEDYSNAERQPSDLKASSRYNRPISTSQAVIKLAPGIDVESVFHEVNHLGLIQHSLRDVLLRSESDRTVLLNEDEVREQIATTGTPIVWAFIATESGVHMAYPGKGGYSEDYDPRSRPWYTMASASPSPSCGLPYEDSMGQGFLLPCSMPIMVNGALKGVAGFDLSLQFLSKAIATIDDYELIESYLLDSNGHIVLEGGEGNWQTDNSELFANPALLHAIAQNSNGVFLDRNDDHTEMLVFRELEALKWTYVVRIDMNSLFKPEAGDADEGSTTGQDPN